MLRTPPAPRKPKRRSQVEDHEADQALIEEIKRNPDKLDELARQIGGGDPTDE